MVTAPKKVAEITQMTEARLRKLASDMAEEDGSWPSILRDIIHVLAIHIRKMGQEELGEQIEEFLIGHTTPSATPQADPGTPNKGA